MDFLKNKPVIALAPMAGMTNETFRKALCLIKSQPNLFFTEFVPVESIRKAGEKTLDALYYSACEKPVIAQFYGKVADDFYLAALITGVLGFDGIDLNLGCSVKKVFAKGGGAGLIGKEKEVKKIAAAIKDGFDDYKKGKDLKKLKLRKEVREKVRGILKYCRAKPDKKRKITFSVKTRLGIKRPETEKWISFLTSLGPDFISLHGRTVKQSFGGCADWEEIGKAAQIAHKSNVPLFGNGDIGSLAEAKEKMEKHQVDGVLIGRKAMANPWIFKNLKKEYKPNKKEILKLIELEAKLFAEILPWRNFKEMRSHFAAYCRGFDGARDLRVKLIEADNYAEVNRILRS